jgi:hypothetical protein
MNVYLPSFPSFLVMQSVNNHLSPFSFISVPVLHFGGGLARCGILVTGFFFQPFAQSTRELPGSMLVLDTGLPFGSPSATHGVLHSSLAPFTVPLMFQKFGYCVARISFH